MRQASAQLLATLETAARYATVYEYNQAGNRIIKESGWLPGVGGMLQYQVDQWEVFGTADIFSRDIHYEGRLQNGRPFNSKTATQLLHAQLGARFRVLPHSQIITALQYDSWKRSIKGDGTATGLREHSRSLRFRLGAEHAWEVDGLGEFSGALSLIFAAPEQLDIQFSGLLDRTSLRTRSSRGFAIEAMYRPKSTSRLIAGAQLDYLRVPRSNAHAVTRAGRPAGEIIQPEHIRKNVTLFVRYLF